MTAVPTDARFTSGQSARLAEIEAAEAAPESFDPIAALRRVEALAEELWGMGQRIGTATAGDLIRTALRPVVVGDRAEGQ